MLFEILFKIASALCEGLTANYVTVLIRLLLIRASNIRLSLRLSLRLALGLLVVFEVECLFSFFFLHDFNSVLIAVKLGTVFDK